VTFDHGAPPGLEGKKERKRGEKWKVHIDSPLEAAGRPIFLDCLSVLGPQHHRKQDKQQWMESKEEGKRRRGISNVLSLNSI